METDEQAIHQLVKTWMAASKAGDLDKVLSLMSDDALFMVPGAEPFGRETFIKGSEAMKDVTIEGTNDIQELKVLGDWAWLRGLIRVTMTMPDGTAINRKGYTLTILRKETDGKWVLFRDANLILAK